jgi:hypothetical protein
MSEEMPSTYESSSPPEHVSPRPFGEIPGLWLKIFEMTEGFFAQEAPRGSGSNTLIAVLILAVVSAILAAIGSLIGAGIQTAFLPPEQRQMLAASAGGGVFGALCCGSIGGFIGFYLGNGLVYLGARLFGGDGDFATQAYLVSLFAVPLGIVSSLVGLAPFVGGLIGLVVSVYGFILNVRAVKVAHRLSTGKAVGAILVPALVIGLIVACLLVLFGAAIFAVFTDLMKSGT